MAAESEALVYVCCFCGRAIATGAMPRWTLSLHRDLDEGSQDLFAHPGCLRRVVQPSVPLLSSDG